MTAAVGLVVLVELVLRNSSVFHRAVERGDVLATTLPPSREANSRQSQAPTNEAAEERPASLARRAGRREPSVAERAAWPRGPASLGDLLNQADEPVADPRTLTGALAAARRAMAERGLTTNPMAKHLCIGAFHAIDRDGDRQEARRYLEQAGAEGQELLTEIAPAP